MLAHDDRNPPSESLWYRMSSQIAMQPHMARSLNRLPYQVTYVPRGSMISDEYRIVHAEYAVQEFHCAPGKVPRGWGSGLL